MIDLFVGPCTQTLLLQLIAQSFIDIVIVCSIGHDLASEIINLAEGLTIDSMT